MRSKILVYLSILGFCSAALGKTPVAAATKDVVPLDQVVTQVQAALDEYQQNLGSGQQKLPKLKSVEFDFKTTTKTTESGGITIFIFKIGVSHETDLVSDLTFSYGPKPPEGAKLGSAAPPPDLKTTLAKAIQQAAKVAAGSTTALGLPLQSFTVVQQFGVTWDLNASGAPVLSLITVNLGGEKNRNQVQSVKLVFAPQ